MANWGSFGWLADLGNWRVWVSGTFGGVAGVDWDEGVRRESSCTVSPWGPKPRTCELEEDGLQGGRGVGGWLVSQVTSSATNCGGQPNSMRVTVLKNAQLALCVRGWHTHHRELRRLGDAANENDILNQLFSQCGSQRDQSCSRLGANLVPIRRCSACHGESWTWGRFGVPGRAVFAREGASSPPGQRSGWSGLSFEVDSLIRNGLPSV